MLFGCIRAAMVVCSLLSAAAQQQEPPLPILQGAVVSDGLLQAGVELYLTGDEFFEAGLSDENGSFSFQVPVGVYQLEVRALGCYPMVVKDLVVKGRRPEPLQVFLVRREASRSEDDSVVPQPNLQIHFSLDPPKAGNQVMTGVLTLVNLGNAAILIPTKPWSEKNPLPHLFLRMNIVVSSESCEAWSNTWYGCFPPKGCLALEPSQSFSYAIRFKQGPMATAPPQTYKKPGRFRFDASLFLLHPEGRRTESVEAEFILSVPRLP